MFRSMIVTVLVGLLLSLQPADAAVRRAPSIIGADMVGVDVGALCGVRMTATLADVGKGTLSVDFQLHSALYGVTFHTWKGLAPQQTFVSAEVAECAGGRDTWDRLDVVLYQGRKVLDVETVLKTVVCLPR
jgi:hypothetical protein